MGAIFVFIFKSGLVMMALYLAYRLFLAKAKQPTFNRVVLLLIYIVSPLAILLSEARFGNTTMPAGYLPAIEAVGTRHGASCADSEWPVAILYLWIAGIAVASVAIAVSIINMRRSIRRCSTRRAGSIRVAISDNEGVAPFSTARTIVLSRSDRDDAGSMIIKHELQHIRLLHWLDLAIGHIVAVISWYNPVSWLMIAELKEVHEFQVDKRVISMGVNAREYQYMLLQKTVGRSASAFANSLNYGSIKRRIAMMMDRDTPPARRWLLAIMVPAATVAVYASRVSVLDSFCSSLEDTELIAAEAGTAGKADIRTCGSIHSVRRAGTVATPYYYINGRAYTRLPNDFDENEVESVVVRRDIPDYPDGVYYITLKPGI